MKTASKLLTTFQWRCPQKWRLPKNGRQPHMKDCTALYNSPQFVDWYPHLDKEVRFGYNDRKGLKENYVDLLAMLADQLWKWRCINKMFVFYFLLIQSLSFSDWLDILDLGSRLSDLNS